MIAFVGSTLVPINYDSATLNNVGVVVTNGYNLACIVSGAVSGGVTFTLPANCGKAIAVVKQANPTYHCVQCKPGFYPTRNANDSAQIDTCTAVTNCADSTFVPNICK